jgi:hypothetical protein
MIILIYLLFLKCCLSCETSFNHHPNHAIWIGCKDETPADRERNRLLLKNIIYSKIRDYTFLHDIESMCELVINRLTYNGIVIPNKEDCTNASIQSRFGSTIRDLYANFNYIDNDPMIARENDLDRNRIECQQICNFEQLFANDIEFWFEKYVPPKFVVPPCVYSLMGKDTSTHPSGKDAPGTYPSGSESPYFIKKCEPFKDFNPNTTDWDFESKMTFNRYDPCLECLEWDDIYLVRASMVLYFAAQVNALLIPEITRVWRHQMPEILTNVSVMITLE